LHELSICQALLTQVEDLAMTHGARSVERVTIDLGPLSGVDPTLLADAYEIMRAGSCAAQAPLRIETSAVRVLCDLCGAQSTATPNRLICADCGHYRTRVIAGNELRLRRVELRVDQSISSATGQSAVSLNGE